MMTWNDYIGDTRDAAIDFLTEFLSERQCEDYLEAHDIMMNEDFVTGNGSGSYTYDRAKAEENIKGILDDSYVWEKFHDLGYEEFPDEAESVDVIARIIALDDLYDELEEWFNNNR